MTPGRDARGTVDAVYRLEGARIIAGLARTVHDIGLAEDSLQDAMVAAIEKWPQAGVPANPAAWLTLEAKHRAIDRIRRSVNLGDKLGGIADDERQRIRVDIDAGGHDFAEGHAATVGDDWVRPDLCLEALRLARMLAELVPDDAEAHALAALLELQASRLPARTGDGGAPVRLDEQDRGLWDQLLIARGFRSLLRGRELTDTPGPYAIQAAIAAAHARARTASETDWASIAELYRLLAHVAPSPIVTLNRAVAVSRAESPQAGLRMLEGLADSPELSDHHLLAAVRAQLLLEIGDAWAAAVELRRAAELAPNPREQELLRARAQEWNPVHEG